MNTDVLPRPDWHADALCAEIGGDRWFPGRGGNPDSAKRVCQACPVRGECLDWALEHRERYGGLWRVDRAGTTDLRAEVGVTVQQWAPIEVRRFYSHVGPPNAKGCRLWTGEVNNRGYGRFCTWRGGRRRYLTHRAAFILATGTDPGSAKVLHSCDTPPCCEPAHLRCGTQAENVTDAITRGRAVPPPHPAGENHPRSKLTQRQVDEIRSLGATGDISTVQLATRFSMSKTQIRSILRRKSWGGLTARDNHRGRRAAA